MLIKQYGVTDVSTHNRFTIISHRGNMGSSIDDVRKNVDKMFYQGSFDKIRMVAKSEQGSPDYEYILEIEKSLFEQIIKKYGITK